MTALLRHDPRRFFWDAATPAGLYARRRWLGADPDWQRDCGRVVARLKRGQAKNGSWRGSVLETLHRLMGLHLTQREADRGIEKALSWLLEKAMAPRAAGLARPKASSLAGLPFAPSSGPALALSGALFMASIFGWEEHPRVGAAYGVAQDMVLGKSRLGWGAANNLLRALAVHPVHCRGQAVRLLVKKLAQAQGPNGGWPRGAPFYQVFNALAHLPGKMAAGQLGPALNRLARTQASDGGWGRTDREFKTFLATHALIRLGYLSPAS